MLRRLRISRSYAHHLPKQNIVYRILLNLKLTYCCNLILIRQVSSIFILQLVFNINKMFEVIYMEQKLTLRRIMYIRCLVILSKVED